MYWDRSDPQRQRPPEVRARRSGGSSQKGSYFKDKYRLLSARRGRTRAKVSVAHKILISVYQVLRSGHHCMELGADQLDQVDERRVQNNLVHCFQRLGYTVTTEKQAV